MKLVDRYVDDVTRRLPEKQRADVAKELQSDIEMMIEDRSGKKRPTKRHVYDALVELGSPSQLADRYRERPRYLIGPDYFEPYVSLLKMIYLVVLPLLVFIVVMMEMMTTQSIGGLIVKVIGVAFEASIHIFFWTTVSFWVVEKFTAGQPHDYRWKPEDLPQLPPEQEITRGESFFAIAWSVFAVIATLYQFPAIYALVGPDDVPQFFSSEMWPGWTIGLLLVALLGLGAEWVKLFVGGWTRLTVLLITVVNTITIVFFVSALLLVDSIANSAMLKLIETSFDNPGIYSGVQRGVEIFVFVVVVICLWEIIEAMYKYKKGGKK